MTRRELHSGHVAPIRPLTLARAAGRHLLPRSARAIFRSAVLDPWERHGLPRAYAWMDRRAMRRQPPCSAPRLDPHMLHNVLANSGAVSLARSYASAREVIDAHPDPGSRRQAVNGSGGLALDDAIFDVETQLWELWSYAPLAGFLARYAIRHFRAPSVLELGCGAAHLFYFLRQYGIYDYVGIDGNPLTVAFNPLLQGYEHHFRLLNLQEEIALYHNDRAVAFDLVCCFEVLEHIREDMVDNTLATIRNHMHSASTFFGTASLNEAIDVHVLVRSRDWWLDRFARAGLRPVPDETSLCRSLARRHPFNWNARNTNLFALQRVG